MNEESETPAVANDSAPTPREPVRWTEVFGGFFIALGISLGTSLVLGSMVSFAVRSSLPDALGTFFSFAFAALAPLIALGFVIRSRLRRGRRGQAIGMIIYLGLALLLLSTCAVLAFGWR